jgi:hypothetical protein
MTKKLSKLFKVDESITINRYDNGFMIDVGGKDLHSEYKRVKLLCSTEEELFEIIKEFNSMEKDE